MFTTPTVETERLILRGFEERDVDAYTRIHRHPEVRRSLSIPEDFDELEAWNHLTRWNGQWTLRNSGQWAIELRETGQLIGRCGPHRPPRPDWPGLEIGWTLDPDHWGRGYATEGGAASIEWAFANHDDDHLVSVILPSNTPSQAVARRLGFAWREEKVLSFVPDKPIGIWELPRPS